ncbi:helix-turn-helix transcriptional regulator [Streptomyces sp. adm13(2018)]|uniref:helix-turn-helix transcriptional regulator n=1 Tax=Streptomyces sp. adm13(2018) TaxID=2479007 RepID=UPI001650952E|nr:helix-turn-helix transcriptional regulator [Streptomyces sp. adm13(2018)]
MDQDPAICLRTQLKAALQHAGLSQAQVARELGLSTKHMSQMLTGRAPLTITWASRIAALCGARIEVHVLAGRTTR